MVGRTNVDPTLMFPCRNCKKMQPLQDARGFWDPCDGAMTIFCGTCLPPKVGGPLARPDTVCGVCGDVISTEDISTIEPMAESRINIVSRESYSMGGPLSPRIRIVCKRCQERRTRS